MSEETPSHWKDRLDQIANRSMSRADIAYYVQMHTLSENNERRILALVSAACAAIALVLRDEGSSVVHSIVHAIGCGAFGAALYHEFWRYQTAQSVRYFRAESPVAMKYILGEIRQEVAELTPLVDQVEREMFSEDIAK